MRMHFPFGHRQAAQLSLGNLQLLDVLGLKQCNVQGLSALADTQNVLWGANEKCNMQACCFCMTSSTVVCRLMNLPRCVSYLA